MIEKMIAKFKENADNYSKLAKRLRAQRTVKTVKLDSPIIEKLTKSNVANSLELLKDKADFAK
jgi:hypothetical protein